MNKQEDEDYIDLGVLFANIYKGFIKFIWLLPILCILTPAGAYLYKSHNYYPMYQAKTTFTVSTLDSNQDSGVYSFYYNASTAEQMTKIFPYILNSDALQELIKEELNVKALPGYITATGVSNSNLITMSATGSDPEMVSNLLDAAVKYFPEVSRYVIGETKFNIIQPATISDEPYNKPDYKKVILKGVVSGAAAFFGLVLLYAFLHKTINSEEDIKNILNINNAGAIPEFKFKAHNRNIDERLDISNPRMKSDFIHAFERVAIKVEKRMKSNNWKVLAVTSTVPGEGKSTVSWNLAEMLNRTGKKVLLVDSDMRNPSLCNFITDEEINDGGFVEFLEGKIDAKEAITKLSSGVYYIGGTISTDRTHRLLTSSIFDDFISSQSADYDYIIIDTPPCGIVSDTEIIVRKSDAVLYVVRQDKVSSGKIFDAIQAISASDTPIIGGVLNGASGVGSGYGYQYNKYGGYKKYAKYGENND